VRQLNRNALRDFTRFLQHLQLFGRLQRPEALSGFERCDCSQRGLITDYLRITKTVLDTNGTAA